MPGAVMKTPMKRGLAEANNTRVNVQASPRSAKKLKLDNGNVTMGRASAKVANGSFNGSQPTKSRFEEEVLEKMSQDIETLKYKNAERDQQWRRPEMPRDFDEMTHSVTFQQIEAEEGVLNGGKATVKLFGVTAVSLVICQNRHSLITCHNRTAIRCSCTSRVSFTTSMLPRR
jgi:DNA polymerase delta subunit 1